MEAVKCRSVVVCVVCDLWQEKTNTQLYPWVFTGHFVMGHPPLMDTQQEMVRSMVPEPISVQAHLIQLNPAVALGLVLKEKDSLWCLEQIWNRSHWLGYIYAGLRCCYPEWRLALLILMNHLPWRSSILPVRWWGGSRNEAWASYAEHMKHCSLHQNFGEPNAAWSLPIAFWHLWVPQGLWPCFSVDKDRKVVCTTSFPHSQWLS